MAEKSIELDSVEIAAAVFGNCDRNIRLLEKEFSVTAVCRGTELRLSGEAANVAAAARAVERAQGVRARGRRGDTAPGALCGAWRRR